MVIATSVETGAGGAWGGLLRGDRLLDRGRLLRGDRLLDRGRLLRGDRLLDRGRLLRGDRLLDRGGGPLGMGRGEPQHGTHHEQAQTTTDTRNREWRLSDLLRWERQETAWHR